MKSFLMEEYIIMYIMNASAEIKLDFLTALQKAGINWIAIFISACARWENEMRVYKKYFSLLL
jgi:hypothetical protein